MVEVFSPSTEQIDTREKLLAYRLPPTAYRLPPTAYRLPPTAYRLLPGLREYLLPRQDRVQADLYQRGDDHRWRHLRLTAPDEALPLRRLGAQPSLRKIDADVPQLLA